MAAPLDTLIQKAEQAHRLARAGPHNESTAFFISTQAGHSPHVSVQPPIKNAVVGKLKNSRSNQSKLSDGAHEAFNVFASQSRLKPSEKAMKIIQPTDKGLPSLLGGAPLIDHLAACIKNTREHSDIDPFIQRLRQNRVPIAHKNWVEVTIGESSTSEWEVVHRKLQQIKDRGDSPFIWVPADTESVTLHSDWQQWGGGDFKSILTHISYKASQGTEFLDFPLAESGSPGTGLPCHFVIGDLDSQIHIRLPILCLSDIKIRLRLDTKFPQGLAAIFASFPPTIGVGITDDYVQWARVLFAIWADRSFEHVPKPIELKPPFPLC